MSFDWSAAECSAWALPDEISVSDWAEKNRLLDSKTTAEPGRWRNSRTPYLCEPMDAFSDDMVEDITIVKATQVGGTEAMFNMLGYCIDQDPGPVLFVYPTEPIARKVSATRVMPMIRKTPVLSEHLTPLGDDFATLQYSLDRMIVNFGWAGSPATLASDPKRTIFMDEVDKFPRFSGREGDPIKLAEERTRTFWNRKKVKASTPTLRSGLIWREWEKSDQRQYFVPCPECGKFQAFTFGGIKWPKDEREPETIETKRLAWYECKAGKCKHRITDKDKPAMLAAGVWVPEGAKINAAGVIKYPKGFVHSKRRGYWLPCFYSPWLTFSEIAAEFLRSKDYPELLQNFINSWLAEPWEETTEATEPDDLKKKATTIESGIVPNWVQVLTAGIDVQQDHWYMIVRGWGFNEESQLIFASRLESWQAVVQFAVRYQWPFEDSERPGMVIRLACIDSGYNTDEVYEIVRGHSDALRAIKGAVTLNGPPYRVSIIDRHPGTGAVIKGGLKLWHLDTTLYKDKIARMVTVQPGMPGEWHIHADPGEEYIKQFCAEHKVIVRNRLTGRAIEKWQPRSVGAANHYLDCEVYALAAADMLNVRALQPEGPTEPKPDEPERHGGGWVRQRRGGWLGDR